MCTNSYGVGNVSICWPARKKGPYISEKVTVGNDDDETRQANRKRKIFALICALYKRGDIVMVMEDPDISLGMMPCALALVQQDLNEFPYRWGSHMREYVLWNIDRLLINECQIEGMSTLVHDDEDSSDGSGSSFTSTVAKESFASSNSLTCDSLTGSYKSDNPHGFEWFSLTLTFEILRGWTMPMLDIKIGKDKKESIKR